MEEINEQEIQQESHPNKETRPLEAPYLAHGAADDIRQRENEQTSRKGDGTHDNLLGFKDIGSNQANRKQQPQLHENDTDFFGFFTFLH